MSHFSRRSFPLLLLTALLVAVIAWIASRPAQPPAVTPPPRPALSMLAAPPDWDLLEIYQNTITRSEFERLLTAVFTTGSAWRNCIEIDDAGARIQTGNSPTDPIFHLRFASGESAAPRHW
ncbi:MAG: hypothetical protein ACRDBP_00115, partial [Luteolibacter sp.]